MAPPLLTRTPNAHSIAMRLEDWWKSKSSSSPPDGVIIELERQNALSPLMKKGAGRSPFSIRLPKDVADHANESCVVDVQETSNQRNRRA